MSNKDPLILAPEEPAEEGEGQWFSFPFLSFFVTLSDSVHSHDVNM